MKLAVSNIAWTAEENEAIAELLLKKGVDKIEAAPLALFGKAIEQVSDEDARRAAGFWKDKGIKVVAFQALLFGKPDFALFESEDKRREMAEYLKKVIDIASAVGAGPLVFGSPKNRLKGDLPQSEAVEIAASFFGQLAPYAADRGCTICMEPNAQGYGCDFITHLDEAAELVTKVKRPGFGLQLDAGVMAMNSEQASIVKKYAGLITHAHCSRPYLEAVGAADEKFHREISDALVEGGYSSLISIEMKRDNDRDNSSHVGDAIDFASVAYHSYLQDD